MFIARSTYDALIKSFPEWMRENWEKSFSREWRLSGVTVTPIPGYPYVMGQLRIMVATLTVLDKKG